MKEKVILFFRKKREAGNFSIERSFAETQKAFDEIDFPKPEWFSVSHVSSGLLPRLKMMVEAYRHRGLVNHITGDINFLVLGLPPERTILTILDCGFLRHPNPVIRKIIKWFWLDLPVWHCAFITAISESTKQEIMAYTGCAADKIRVIPVVIPCDFTHSEKVFNRDLPRILHIGTAQNKNLLRHIEALEEIPCVLHIIGKINQEVTDLLERKKVQYINEFELSSEQILKAYQECDLLLFASTIEGFGMPILEAQTIGRPVITSNITSMPEVAGDSACLVDPFSVASIREGVIRVIQDEAYRNALIQKGSENIKRYQPLSIAKQYAQLYAEVISQNK